MVKVKIERLNDQLEGVGHIDGKIIFIPKTKVGEEVDVNITFENNKFLRGEAISNINSDCPYFSKCGGCYLRNYSYEETIKLKEENILNLFKKNKLDNASPPGKKLTTISLLSGGEKTLTAISLLFAILNVRTVPFCLFDEVEAALDEANVAQFGKYLNHYKDKTQFLIITHKKKTMEYANTLYGITMQESGVSKLVSVKLEDHMELI